MRTALVIALVAVLVGWGVDHYIQVTKLAALEEKVSELTGKRDAKLYEILADWPLDSK